MRTHVDSDHVQRSWRTIESARLNANADIDEMRHKPPAVSYSDRDRDIRRKDAGEESMQGAAMVGFVCALIALMMRAFIPVVMMRMLVVGM
jgi:hypothetical protein